MKCFPRGVSGLKVVVDGRKKSLYKKLDYKDRGVKTECKV